MTLQEVVDSFEVMLKLEYTRRRKTPFGLHKKLLALWISQGIQYLNRAVKELQSYEDITLVADTYEYALNSNSDFGTIDFVEVAGSKQLILCSLAQLQQAMQDNNSGQSSLTPSGQVQARRAAVYFKGATPAPYIIFDGVPLANPRVWYYKNTVLYTPAGVSAQPWGSFDGFAFSGNFVLRDTYVEALHEYMMSKVFPDRLPLLKNQVNLLKSDRQITVSDSLPYHLGER